MNFAVFLLFYLSLLTSQHMTEIKTFFKNILQNIFFDKHLHKRPSHLEIVQQIFLSSLSFFVILATISNHRPVRRTSTLYSLPLTDCFFLFVNVTIEDKQFDHVKCLSERHNKNLSVGIPNSCLRKLDELLLYTEVSYQRLHCYCLSLTLVCGDRLFKL